MTVSFSQNGQTVTSVPYGSTVTVTVTIEKAETATNALSADAGKVDFYLGAVEGGTKLNQNDVPVTQGPDGTYTAALEVTLDGEGCKPNESPYTITADFGGHGPEGDESGDRLAPNAGSAELTVTKAEQSAPSAPVVSTAVPPTANSVTLDAITTTGYGDVQYGYTTSGETSVPDDRWQAGTAFDELDPGTTYAFYTRYAGNKCYEPSPASAGTKVTTLRADSTLKVEPDEDTLTYGETLTITVTPEQTAANGINTQTAQNAVELRKGDTVLTGTTTVNDDGSYTLIYDTQDKGLTIGSNTLTVSFGGSGSLNPSTGEVTVTLEKANVNATLDGTTSKTYDGTTAAPAGLTIVLTGVQEGDDVTASSSSITYDSADAGDNRTITANGITLTGADAAYYSLISETASVETGSITAATLSGTLTITGTARYGQQLTASYDPVHEDEAVSYQWCRGGADIPSATGETYDLTAEDVGAEVSVIATATDGNHTGSVTSSPVTVGKAGQDAPAEGQGCSVDFAAETVAAESGYEIAESADATEGAASLAAVPGATIYVRLAATADAFAGVPTAEISVRNPYVPPAQTGPDWDDVMDEIADASADGRVIVDMKGETVLPGEVLEELAGRDVTLVLQMDDGVAWEIHGGDVPEGTPFSDTDMGVEMDTDGIPVEVANLVTGEFGFVQATLAHDGEFGFALTLVAPLGEKYEGLFANLYRHDGAAGVLRYEAAGVVDDEGAARVRLDHASQWLVALDTRLHALPFADADEGPWYSEPVRWAWLSGAMGGYGDGSGLFGTDDALTRAQMAAVLYNLAGKPDVEVSGLPADCGEGEWYVRAVAWALQEGIFSGYGDGSGFGPDDPLTREQAAAVLYNAAGRSGRAPTSRPSRTQARPLPGRATRCPGPSPRASSAAWSCPTAPASCSPAGPAPAPSKSFLRKRGTIRPRIRIFLLLSGPAG